MSRTNMHAHLLHGLASLSANVNAIANQWHHVIQIKQGCYTVDLFVFVHLILNKNNHSTCWSLTIS